MLRPPLLPRTLGLTLLLAALSLGCDDSTGTHNDAAVFTPDAFVAVDSEGIDAQPASSDSQVLVPDTGADDLVSSPVDLGPAVDSGSKADSQSIPDGAGTVMADASPDVTPGPPSTIVVLPDTQYYAYASTANVFKQQTSWVVAQKSVLNVAAVLHVGDLVDLDNQDQWTVADQSMRMFDKVALPYVLVPGNHDYSSVERATTIDNYFAPSSMPWITGTMTAGKIENSYALLDIGPQKWLVVGLEFGPRDAVVDWANAVLKKYAQYPAIIVTHAYLYSDNTRYDINVGGTDSTKSNYQYWSPYYYGFTASQGINDGEQMWKKLVLPSSNVRLIFCGHQTGWARLTSVRPDGTSVHQMLSDYQWWSPDGAEHSFGYGWLRIVQLDYDKKTIQVQTYSPYLQQYLQDDSNQFTLPLNL